MNIKVVLLLTLYISVPLNLLFDNEFLSAQVDNDTNNGSNQAFTLDNNASRGIGIMENTSGMIDEAFDALKDSFGSFFGK